MNKIIRVAPAAMTVAILGLMVVACGSGGSPSAEHSSATPYVTPSPTATHISASTLSSKERRFVRDMRADYSWGNSVADSDIASFGDEVCSDRATESQKATIAAVKNYFTGGDQANMTRLAERDMCHRYLPPPPKPRVLVSLSGSGIQNSAPFHVGSGNLTVSYSYDCSSFGGSGNFIADLLYGNQSSLDSDDLSIANALGPGGQATTHVYPQYPGRSYYLSVNSECNWTVTVKGR